jgi:hypothetical protein
MRLHRPSPATILAGLALFVALGGPAQAARTLKLKAGSVTTTAIKNRTIRESDLQRTLVAKLLAVPSGAVGAAQVKDGALGAADLAPGAVTGDRIAPGAVTGDRIAAGTIAGDRIAANAIDAGRIVDGAVGAAEIPDGAIDTGEIADGRLRGADIGRFAGELTGVDFGTVTSNSCKTVASTSLTAVGGVASQDLSDDAIIATPSAAWPENVTLLAKPAGTNQIALSVCKIGAGDVNLGSRSFDFVSVDANGN